MAAAGLRRRKIELLLEDLDQIPTLPGLAHHVLGIATAEHPGFEERAVRRITMRHFGLKADPRVERHGDQPHILELIPIIESHGIALFMGDAGIREPQRQASGCTAASRACQ